MIGNKNLTKGQVATLLQFAQFIERYLINRGGVLKDQSRRGLMYGSARAAADWFANLSARTIFALGRARFERGPAT
jgi:hypothetical protein